jgi:hypothetical protein
MPIGVKRSASVPTLLLGVLVHHLLHQIRSHVNSELEAIFPALLDAVDDPLQDLQSSAERVGVVPLVFWVAVTELGGLVLLYVTHVLLLPGRCSLAAAAAAISAAIATFSQVTELLVAEVGRHGEVVTDAVAVAVISE